MSFIYTAHDAVDHLLTATGGGAQDGEHRAIRQAVIHGVREVLQCRQWLWHTKTGYFKTQQLSTTATITANSDQIVVGSTANMVVGRILEISSEYFADTPRITQIINSTTVRLNYAASKSGTSVPVLIQTYYDLPADVKDIDALVSDTVGTLHCYITPQDWQRLEINTKGSGEPYYYTIMRSDLYPDRFQVRFVGVPTNNTVIHYTYRYIPETIKYMGYELPSRDGTVNTVAGTPMTITGTGTSFAADMAGSMIRFGTADRNPEPIGALVPYVAQAKIATFTAASGAAALSIEGTVPVLSGVKYCVTDIVDCSPQMWTAVLSATEMWYARLAGKPGGDVVQLFNRDLRLAMENDAISPLSGRPRLVEYPTARSMGWRSAPMPDTT